MLPGSWTGRTARPGTINVPLLHARVVCAHLLRSGACLSKSPPDLGASSRHWNSRSVLSGRASRATGTASRGPTSPATKKARRDLPQEAGAAATPVEPERRSEVMRPTVGDKDPLWQN